MKRSRERQREDVKVNYRVDRTGIDQFKITSLGRMQPKEIALLIKKFMVSQKR